MSVDFPLLDVPAARTGYMYGTYGWTDSPCASDYDPHSHAAMLDLPIVYRDLPDRDMVAAFSAEHRAIFLRPNLHGSVERCAIAHEIVHFEHNDIGCSPIAEARADRIAARRLIRPWRLHHAEGMTDDPGAIALELGVTERIMRAYQRAIERGLYGTF